MVQIEAPSTPECQEGIPSQGGQHREEHCVVQHVQVERVTERVTERDLIQTLQRPDSTFHS